MPGATNNLSCSDLTVAVEGRVLVENLNLDIDAGTFVCVLGTNGVGKSLTLHTLAGLRQPQHGEVRLNGTGLQLLQRRQIARQLGLLLQIHEDTFPLTVLDTVLMGRYPYHDLWSWQAQDEQEIARSALAALDLHDLDGRMVNSLSGGERERVALATLVTQDPAIWLLDEPTNHLDPHHQLTVLDLLRWYSTDKRRVIVTTVHNPALAMRYADQALLLYGEGEWEYGPANELLEPGRLERMYQTPFDYFADSKGQRRVLLPA